MDSTKSGGKLPGWAHHPKVKTGLRVAFAVIAISISVYAVSVRWDEVSRDLARISWIRVALSGPLMVAALVCGMESWRAVLADLGSRLPFVDAARIYFIGQLGKYIPGSVWPLVAQMELGRDHAIPRRRSVAALIVAIVISLVTGLVAAGATAPALSSHGHRELVWLIPVAVLALPLLYPRLLWTVLSRVPMLHLDRGLGSPISPTQIARPVSWAGLGWVAYGLHLVVLAGAFPTHGAAQLIGVAIGGYALAWCAGLIAFLLPAGAGARDLVIVFALSTQIPLSAAVAVAVVSRAMTTVCDLGCAAVVAVGVRTRLRSVDPAALAGVGAE